MAIRLLDDEPRRIELAENARRYVEAHSSAKRVAEVFERICVDALKRSRETERRSRTGRAAEEAITRISARTAR